jgi:hypothetical protein
MRLPLLRRLGLVGQQPVDIDDLDHTSPNIPSREYCKYLHPCETGIVSLDEAAGHLYRAQKMM